MVILGSFGLKEYKKSTFSFFLCDNSVHNRAGNLKDIEESLELYLKCGNRAEIMKFAENGEEQSKLWRQLDKKYQTNCLLSFKVPTNFPSRNQSNLICKI